MRAWAGEKHRAPRGLVAGTFVSIEQVVRGGNTMPANEMKLTL